MCEAEYYNDDDVLFHDNDLPIQYNDVLLQNANNANDNTNDKPKDNANNKLNDIANNATALTLLSLEDIKCDYSPVKE